MGPGSPAQSVPGSETVCGCAGCYTAYAGIELYAEAFDSIGALDKLEGFASRFGPAFYDLPLNETRLTLIDQPWRAPDELAYGDGRLTPLRAGEEHAWQLAD